MPPTGSTFTDWQQVERESRLFTEGDFDWSEPPPRRRRITEAARPAARQIADESRYASFDEPSYSAFDEPIRVSRRATAVLEYEREPYDDDEASLAYEPLPDDRPPAQTEPRRSRFDEMMAEWNAAYGDGAKREGDRPRRDSRRAGERSYDLSDPGSGGAAALDARRTVVITGRGDERYVPALRLTHKSALRFHERSSFSPDRAGLWALLLGIALVIGAVVH